MTKPATAAKHAVARKRLPASGFGVQLPEAMALCLAAASQIGGDRSDEEEQEHECSRGAPPGGGGRYEGCRHRQLG